MSELVFAFGIVVHTIIIIIEVLSHLHVVH